MSSIGSFGYGHSIPDDDALAYSFPNDLGYGDELNAVDAHHSDENRPRIILAGPRRAGKSSIAKVVFHKMSPNETLFLEPTSVIVRDVWDLPGDIEFDDPSVDADLIFKKAGALVFVIDAQDDYNEGLARLHATVARCFEVNPACRFEVFIHKVDGLTDEQKLAGQRAIQQQAMEELTQSKLDGIHLNFYSTSIYDHSVFESFSKVVQKLIPQLPTLENLLDILLSNCRLEKAFLIDIVSKIYVATDSGPVDMQTYELCADMIDVVIDISKNGVLAHDPKTSSIIRLNNGTVLYLREVRPLCALVCIIRGDKFEKQGLIDYNFDVLKRAIDQVIEVGRIDTSAPAPPQKLAY